MDELLMVDLLFAEPPAPTPDVAARSRAALLRRADGGPGRARGPRGAWRPRRIVTATVGAAAVGAAAAITLAALSPTGTAQPRLAGDTGALNVLPGRPAHAFLLAMAAKSTQAPAHGRFWCQTAIQASRELVGAGNRTLAPAWLNGGDPAQASTLPGFRYSIFSRVRWDTCLEPPRPGWNGGTVGGWMQDLGATPASPADRAAWRQDGAPRSWHAWYDSTQTIQGKPGPRFRTGPKVALEGSATWAVFASMTSTDPAKIRAALLTYSGTPGHSDKALFHAALSALDAPSSPAVHAAIYRFLAGLEGVSMQPGVHGPAGTVGTAIWYGSPHSRPVSVTLIDPATGRLVADADITSVWIDGMPPGTVLTYDVYGPVGWTNHLPVPMSFVRQRLRMQGQAGQHP